MPTDNTSWKKGLLFYYNCKGTIVKFTLEQAMKVQMGSSGIALLFL
jgi:hypothetical protein